MSPRLGPLERLVLIRDGLYSSDPIRRRRAGVILALDRGLRPTEVARGAGCSRSTVYGWLRVYLEYRDPRALSGVDPTRGGGDPGARACAVNALSPAPWRPGGTMSPGARAALRTEAKTAPDPRLRLRAAVAWALERGVRPTRVERASGMSRQAAHKVWKARAKETGA